MKWLVTALSVGGLLLGTGSAATAASITFTGTNGSNLSASATFDTSGTNLVVTLTNTSLVDLDSAAQLLTALFFDVAADPLGTVSAVLNAGSAVIDGTTDPGGVVGGEWAYAAGIDGPGASTEGISSSGFGLFGPTDNFPGSNLQGPVDVDGAQYGIVSAGWLPAGDNASIGNAKILNSVVFTLSGLPAGFDPSAPGAITNVGFQYGTALSEGPVIPGDNPTGSGPVPEPASLILMGSGLAGVAMKLRRRKS